MFTILKVFVSYDVYRSSCVHSRLCSCFSGVRVAQSIVFCVVFCRSLFLFLSFIVWSLITVGGVMVHARLECGRSWVRTSIGSNQRLWHWYLLLIR